MLLLRAFFARKKHGRQARAVSERQSTSRRNVVDLSRSQINGEAERYSLENTGVLPGIPFVNQ